MTNELSLPSPLLSPEQGLKRYLQQIRTFPILTEEEEFMLAKRWKEHGDVSAAHRLTTSHLRLVAKIAMGYRGYGLPVSDLIAEGNIGVMQAVKRYDPDKGFRFATYAIWWIKAAIQEYVLKSWSLVKIGTSAAQKRLFFNLRKLRRKIGAVQEGGLTYAQADEIAGTLDVSRQDVLDMDTRLMGADASLNKHMTVESDDEWLDMLAEPADNQETRLADAQDSALRSTQLARAMSTLNEREQAIIQRRRLKDEPDTLEALSQDYNISRERVRQIEVRALEKLQKAMVTEAAAA